MDFSGKRSDSSIRRTQLLRQSAASTASNSILGDVHAAAAERGARARDARFGLPRQVADELLARLVDRRDLRVTVIVAHADDESIGAGGLLTSLPRASVICVSDGAPCDVRIANKKGFASREEYANARRQELLRALSLANIPPERVYTLGMEDGTIARRLVEAARGIAALLETLRPDIVLTHPFEGGHTDHDATAFGTHLACGRLRLDGAPAPIVFELTSYHNRNGRRVHGEFLNTCSVPTRALLLPPAARFVKAEMFRCYESQRSVLECFPLDLERFRVAPRYRFFAPPHEGPLEYERHVSDFTGADWCAAAERALNELRGS